MTTVKTTARHRRARRPLAPVTDTLSSLSMSPIRGTAVVSVTGLALTAAVSAAANAAPVALSDAAQQSPTAKISTLSTTVTVPDIAWTASDEVAASAEAPAPEPEPEPVETVTATAATADTTTATATTQAASRSETREAVAVPASAAGSSIASIALSMLGIPYVYGGSSMAGADCSGFVQMVYAQAGISLPRTSQAQQAGGTIVSVASAQAGDIVSWGYHVGIYLGDGMMVDSSKPGTVTSVRSVWGSPVYVRY